ncbi:MAG: hypothetical protein L3K19_01415 [Thermoplasmata archaeon]|nr:hypothetical protein [Thermoplasmata archaeon]
MSGTRTKSMGSGRLLAFGATGFATAVTLLMVLAPAGAGAHPNLTMTAPYKHTAWSPQYYSSVNGCAAAATTKSLWNPTTGTVTFSDAAAAKVCKAIVGQVGSYSSAYTETGGQLAIPFTVSSNGAHSITSSWTVNIASALAKTTGGCPKPNVAPTQPYLSSAYAYCESGNEVSFYMSGYVSDLNNGSWYNYNGSYADAYNYSFWENYTSCSNYGTPSCYNSTTGYGYLYSYGYNEVGLAAWTFNGATTFTMWNNGTNMVKGHHYVLYVSLSDDKEAYADAYNLLGHWAGSASASINMATLGNGAKLNSVAIV